MKAAKSTLLKALEKYQSVEDMAEVRFDVSVFDEGEGCLMYSFLSKSGRVANYGNPAKSLLFYILKQYDMTQLKFMWYS